MHALLTVAQVLLFGLGVWALWRTTKAADGVRTLHDSLKNARMQVAQHDEEIEGLGKLLEKHRSRLKSVEGKFYAMRQLDFRPEEGPRPEGYYARVVPESKAPACENWATAQIEGPSSTAAACQCEYCELRRAERSRLRASVIPATVAAPSGDVGE